MTEAAENPLSSNIEPAPSIWKPALREAAWTLLAAAILLIILYTLAFKHIHPEFVRFMGQEAKPLSANGKDFIPISVGKGRKAGSQYIIEDFNGDEAILVLPRRFRAEDYPFIKVNVSGFTRYSRAKLLWQKAADPTIYALKFNRSEDGVTQIAMVSGGEEYRGQIESIALLFYDGPALGFENNDDIDITIKNIELRPFTATNVAIQILQDWINPPLLSAHSNNFIRGAHINSLLPPNLIANVLVMTGILMTLLRTACLRKLSTKINAQSRYIPIAVCLCLLAWTFNETLRWHWRIEQYADVFQRFDQEPLEKRIYNSDIRCQIMPPDCGGSLLPYF